MVDDTTKQSRKSLAIGRSRAKSMRHAPAAMEKHFWSLVRDRRLDGLKFKRQVPIGPYIADFVCAEHRVIVELDGPLHRGRESYDAARDSHLERAGYTVLRFTNADLGLHVSSVMATILHTIRTQKNPLPHRGRGQGEGAAKSKPRSDGSRR